MENIARKYLRGEIKKILNEDYESIKEIDDFSNIIVEALAASNYDNIVNNIKRSVNSVYFYPVLLSRIYTVVDKEYKKIGDFIKNTNIQVYITKKSEKSNRYGQYQTAIGDYNPKLYREIVIFYGNYFLNDLEQFFEKDNISEYKFYEFLKAKIVNSVIHELQHAYDDYRSKNKIFQSKEFEKFAREYDTEEKILAKKEDLNAARTYLNLQVEIWARFSQAILKMEFIKSEWDLTKDGENFYYTYEMRPLNYVLTQFFNKFEGWNQLREVDKPNELSKMQKRLIKAVVQFWHKEQDDIRKKNANPEIIAIPKKKELT